MCFLTVMLTTPLWDCTDFAKSALTKWNRGVRGLELAQALAQTACRANLLHYAGDFIFTCTLDLLRCGAFRGVVRERRRISVARGIGRNIESCTASVLPGDVRYPDRSRMQCWVPETLV
jgi:hypothetical protein